jgi:hypothetical protein
MIFQALSWVAYSCSPLKAFIDVTSDSGFPKAPLKPGLGGEALTWVVAFSSARLRGRILNGWAIWQLAKG